MESLSIVAKEARMVKRITTIVNLVIVLSLLLIACKPTIETVVVEKECEGVKFKIRTDKITWGGISATGTLTKCGTPLPDVEIRGKNLNTGQTGKVKTDKNGQVKIGNLLGGRIMEGHRIQVEFTVDGKTYIKCFKAIIEDNVDWSEIPCPPTPTP
jgi:hypothetical protein